MRATILCLLLLSLSLASGCNKAKKAPAAQEGPIVPTGREREVLAVHNIDPASERGQDKLRKMRERQEKLEAARERMQVWAEEAAKREAEEAGP